MNLQPEAFQMVSNDSSCPKLAIGQFRVGVQIPSPFNDLFFYCVHCLGDVRCVRVQTKDKPKQNMESNKRAGHGRSSAGKSASLSAT